MIVIYSMLSILHLMDMNTPIPKCMNNPIPLNANNKYNIDCTAIGTVDADDANDNAGYTGQVKVIVSVVGEVRGGHGDYDVEVMNDVMWNESRRRSEFGGKRWGRKTI